MVGKTIPAMRSSTLVVTGALLVSACSGTSTDPTTTTPPTPTTSTTVAPTTTTTAAPTTTTVAEPPVTTTTTLDPLVRPEVLISNMNRESIDDFDTTGDDLYQVAIELFDLFNFLEGSPAGQAEDMLLAIMEPGYPHWESILASFRELELNPGWHYVDPGIEVFGVEVVRVQADVAVVRVADARGDQIIADADQAAVKTYDGWPREVTSFTFLRGPDGKWRFGDLEPSEPISDEQLAEMVPVDWTERAI